MTDFDFDQARRERPPGFIIAGERFALRDPGFKETSVWQDAEPPDEGGQTAADAQTVEFIEKFIAADEMERWRSLLDRKTDALTRGDILGLARWLMEQHTERPTIRPSSSERGPTSATTGSSAGRRLQAATPGA